MAECCSTAVGRGTPGTLDGDTFICCGTVVVVGAFDRSAFLADRPDKVPTCAVCRD